MQIEVLADDFLTELELVTQLAGKNTIIPILGHVLLEAAAGNRITLSGTDASTALVTSCAAGVKRPGKALLPASELTRLAKAVAGPGNTVTITEDGDRWFVIEAGLTRVRLPGADIDDFPKLPKAGDVGLVAPRKRLADMVRRVLFIPKLRSERAGGLDGVLLRAKTRELTVASTNGASAAYCRCALDQSGELLLFVNTQPAGLLLKLLDSGEGDAVHAGTALHGLYFTVGPRTLYTPTEEMTWPSFEKAMETRPDSAAFDVETADLVAAIRTASIVSTSGAVKLEATSGRLTAVAAGDKGDGRRAVAVEYDGDDRDVTLSSEMILGYLGACGTDSVHLTLLDKDNFIHMKPSVPGEFVYRYSLAPRVS
jgi:DNA polymerase-3 subunit beta